MHPVLKVYSYEHKWDKTTEGKKAQLFISLRYRGTNQLMIYSDCKRFKGSVEDSLKIYVYRAFKYNFTLNIQSYIVSL